MSKCPKCGEDRWIIAAKKLPNHPYNVHFVECDACHVGVGAFEKSYEFNSASSNPSWTL
jgi:hypothetical protein